MITLIPNNSRDTIKETPQVLARISYTYAKNNVTIVRKKRLKAPLRARENKHSPRFHKGVKKMEQVAKAAAI